MLLSIKERNYGEIIFRKTLFQKKSTEALKKYKKHKKFCSIRRNTKIILMN